jgi:hypothetical protein
LIVAELLYAYKFLVELWEMIRHINQQPETIFMLGVLGLIDVTMVANLLTMVIIGCYATFVSIFDYPYCSRGFVTKPPRRQARRARGAQELAPPSAAVAVPLLRRGQTPRRKASVPNIDRPSGEPARRQVRRHRACEVERPLYDSWREERIPQ